MTSGKPKNLKVVFIASILLNFAFISGFTIKKIHNTHIHKASSLKMHQNHSEKDQAVTCIRKLCQKNPDFKKILTDHQNYCHNRCNDLAKIKTKLLSQLKNRQTKPDVIHELNHQINNLTHELHDRNHRHLLLLKQHLNKEDYASLIDHMIDVLDKQHLSSVAGKGEPNSPEPVHQDVKPIDNKH